VPSSTRRARNGGRLLRLREEAGLLDLRRRLRSHAADDGERRLAELRLAAEPEQQAAEGPVAARERHDREGGQLGVVEAARFVGVAGRAAREDDAPSFT
jgi:hypothetical protein